MDIDSYNKLPYKERLAFVSQLKIRPMIDPVLEVYDEDFTADFPLPYTAINREGAKIIRINSVNPELSGKCIRPVNTNILILLRHMEGRKSVLEEAEARIEMAKALIRQKKRV